MRAGVRGAVVLVGALVLAGGLAGCGGGSVERPTVAELTDVLVRESEADGDALTHDQAYCVAEKFVNSDLSDEMLRAFADLQEGYTPSEEQEEIFADVLTEAATECVD